MVSSEIPTDVDANGNDRYKKAASPIELAAFPNVWWSWRTLNEVFKLLFLFVFILR